MSKKKLSSIFLTSRAGLADLLWSFNGVCMTLVRVLESPMLPVSVKNVLKGQIQRAWLQLVCCTPYLNVREQEIRLIQTKSELEREQRRTTRGRGGGDKSTGINPKTSGGQRERTQVKRRKE
ncbi:hypothetical protein C8R48DRAFT_669673 [Suillus tomentosus]|nr:hypothetical protein C8R48DRAFT_669673 [Suillus tomentosus]